MTRTTVYARKKYSLAARFAAGLLLAAVTAMPAQAAEIKVSEAVAHVMEDSVNGRRIEVYMTIENAGAARDRLYAVRSELARNTMLAVPEHEDEGAGASGHGSMAHSEAAKHMQSTVLDIPAGAETRFQHGKSHIMLMQPKETPAVGASFPVTLFFERAGRMSVEVTVVPMDMGH
jgi:copper(I)-binding protein